MTDRRLPDLSPVFGAIFALVVLGLIAVLNTWAALDRVVNNTISAWVTFGGQLTAAVPLFVGAVAGHWASRGQDLPPIPGGPLPVLALVALLVVADWRTQGALARYPFWIWLLFGIPIGAVLWPMADAAG